MTATESSREIAAIASHVRGKSLSFGLGEDCPLPSSIVTKWDPQEEGKPWPTIAGVLTGSIDTVVAIWELERMPDPLACMQEWRRILRDGGRLIVALHAAGTSDEPVRHTFTPSYLVALINRLGGFNIAAIEDIVPDASWMLIAERSFVAEIRAPLGTIGSELAGRAREHEDSRVELYFQIGTVFLQAGDPVQAEGCFKRMLAMETDSTDGLFGLGMSYGSQGRWNEARVELQKVMDHDPNNEDAARWLMLAVERTGETKEVPTKNAIASIPRAGSLRVPTS